MLIYPKHQISVKVGNIDRAQNFVNRNRGPKPILRQSPPKKKKRKRKGPNPSSIGVKPPPKKKKKKKGQTQVLLG